jgi:hypothetical protein
VKMKLWVIVLVVCVVAVLIAALAIRAAVLKAKRTRTERQLLTRPCDPTVDGTIFVSIINDTGSREHGASTVLSLFREAKCPMRLRVNVYDIIAANSVSTPPPLLDALRASGRGLGYPMDKLLHLVRVLQVPATLYRGPLAAREQLERFTYTNEVYMMTIQAGAVVAPGWDELCVKCLGSAVGPRPYLTTRLEVLGEPFPRADPKLPGTYVAFTPESARAGRVVAYKLRRFKATGTEMGPGPGLGLGLGLGLGRGTGPRPGFTPPVPAVAWSSSFSFTTGARAKAFKIPVLADTNEDAAMWGVLVQHGWTNWFHTQFTVAVVPAAAAAVSAKVGAGLRTPPLSGPTLKTLGLNLLTLAPTTRARVGLTARPTVDEIDIKLGSMDEYASLVSRVELTNI